MRRILPLLALATCIAAADWPCWRGPDGNAYAPYEGELVTSFADAKLVWQSEAEVLQTYPEGLKGQCYEQSGQCGPIVYDGRVYQYWYDSAGEWYDRKKFELVMKDARTMQKEKWLAAMPEAERAAFLKNRFALLADDVLLCVDARTGKTLWRQVWQEKGVSHAFQVRGTFIAAKTGPHAKPCAGEGKVFVLGSAGLLYAVDAAKGTPLWEVELPGHRGLMEKVEAGKKALKIVEPGRTFCGNCPAYADGTVVVGMGSHVYGYDAKDGAQKWQVENVGSSSGSPVVWRDGGKTYVIAGKPALIDPADGKVLWTWTGEPAVNPDYLTVGEGHIVSLSREKMQRTIKTGKGEKEDYAAVGFRFDAKGIEHAWTQPDGSMSHYIRPVIAHGHLWARNSGSNAKDYFYVLDLKDGKMVAKSGYTGVGGRTSGSMIMAGDRLLMDRADVIVADPRNFAVREPDEQWSYVQKIPGHDLLHANSVAMAFADGFVYLRTQHRLACLDLRAR